MNGDCPERGLRRADSDYLCPFCGNLLYVCVDGSSGWFSERNPPWPLKEACINPSCAYSHEHSSDLRANNDRDRSECSADFCQAIEECYDFTHKVVFQTLYQRRAVALQNFPSTADMRTVLTMDYLMVYIDKSRGWGACTDTRACNEAIDLCVSAPGNPDFTHGIKHTNTLTDGTKTYHLKYDRVINCEILKEIGLINPEKYGPEDVNKFSLDEEAGAEAKYARDFDGFLQRFYTQIMLLNRAFNMHRFSRTIHQYPAKVLDLATLLSLWQHCKRTGHYAFDAAEIQRRYEWTARKNGLPTDFERFLETYASGRTLAPVLVFDGERYWFDWHTLFVFLSYIASLNNSVEGCQSVSGHQVLSEQSRKLGSVFESRVRKHFRNLGWEVLPAEGELMKLRTGSQEREYDCIAVDHASKLVVLAEAKFENMPPSAMSAVNLINHTVLDKSSGLLHYAQRHHERSRFFRLHPKTELGMEWPWTYRVASVIVTKHTPIFNRYLTVQIIPYHQLGQFDFGALYNRDTK